MSMQNMKYESVQQLADLQVECLNKDKTIQEHEKHIEEMKDIMQEIEIEIGKLRKKQIETEEQHRKDIETMVNTIVLNRDYLVSNIVVDILFCF
jgi:predicted GNAT superfamily acetyltransferase